MAIDIFQNDAYSTVSLTRHINIMPYVPTRIGDMNLFNDRVDGTDADSRMSSASQNGIYSDTAVVSSVDGRLMLLPTAGRGTMPTYNQQDKVVQRPFKVPYIPKNDGIFWDELIGKAIFGSDLENQQSETVAMATDRKMMKIRKEHYLTWEYHRLGAIKGVILDANGTDVVYDLFSEFGVTKKTVTYTTSLAAVSEAIVEHIGNVLGAESAQGIHCFVGKDFFEKVQAEAELKEAFARWNDGEFLRTSYQAGMYTGQPVGFTYRGVTYERYRGILSGITPMVADDKAHAFPVGTDRFARYNAPGTVSAAVGTLGLPMYVVSQPKPFDQGVDFHSQSNPLFMCTQPGVLVEITVA